MKSYTHDNKNHSVKAKNAITFTTFFFFNSYISFIAGILIGFEQNVYIIFLIYLYVHVLKKAEDCFSNVIKLMLSLNLI